MPASKIFFISYLFTVFTVCLSPAHLSTLPQKTVALQDRMLCVLLTLRPQCLERPGTRQVISYQDDLLPGWMAEHWPVFRQRAK